MRVQRSRERGWRMPAGAIVVSRGTKWGNPHKVPRGDVNAARTAVNQYREDLYAGRLPVSVADVIHELAGRTVVCWCRETDKNGQPFPCHGDVLMEIANA